MKHSPTVLPLVLLMFAALACGGDPSVNRNAAAPAPTPAPNVKLYFNALALAEKSPAEVDKILGKPTAITPITDDPQDMPGEYRDYAFSGAKTQITPSGLEVRFQYGRAIFITIDLDRSYANERDALRAIGIDLNSTDYPPAQRAPMAATWPNVLYHDVYFKEIKVLNMNGPQFDSVQLSILPGSSRPAATANPSGTP